MCFSKTPQCPFIIDPIEFPRSLESLKGNKKYEAALDLISQANELIHDIEEIPVSLPAVQEATRNPTNETLNLAYQATKLYAKATEQLFTLWDSLNTEIFEMFRYMCANGGFSFNNDALECHTKCQSSKNELALISEMIDTILQFENTLFDRQISNQVSNFKRFCKQLDKEDDLALFFYKELRYSYMFNQFGEAQMLAHIIKQKSGRGDTSRIYACLVAGIAIFMQNQFAGVNLMSAFHSLQFCENDCGLLSVQRKQLMGAILMQNGVVWEDSAWDCLIAIIGNCGGGAISKHKDFDKALTKMFK